MRLMAFARARAMKSHRFGRVVIACVKDTPEGMPGVCRMSGAQPVHTTTVPPFDSRTVASIWAQYGVFCRGS